MFCMPHIFVATSASLLGLLSWYSLVQFLGAGFRVSCSGRSVVAISYIDVQGCIEQSDVYSVVAFQCVLMGVQYVRRDPARRIPIEP